METYIGRIVVLVTPIIAGISGFIVQWVADNFPGAPSLDDGQLTAIFIAGVTAGGAAIFKWLDGRSKYERGVSSS